MHAGSEWRHSTHPRAAVLHSASTHAMPGHVSIHAALVIVEIETVTGKSLPKGTKSRLYSQTSRLQSNESLAYLPSKSGSGVLNMILSQGTLTLVCDYAESKL